MVRDVVLPVPLLLAACGPVEPLALIATSSLPDGRVAMDYQTWLETGEDASPEASWSLDAGSLPPGLDLSSDGAISGTPTRSGDFDFSVVIEDLEGEDFADLSIHVPPVCLMSGYEPFGGYPINPSIESLRPLHEQLVAGLDLRVVELPVVWDEAWEVLSDEISALDPSVVISTGQAGTDAMRFETVAENVENGTDNDGVQRSGLPVVEGGPTTLADRLPEAEMAFAMEEAGYATTISSSAGTYLCNYIFYRLMYYAEYESERDLTAGFIHVSPATEGYSFSVEDITAAHTAGLGALSNWMASGSPLSPALPVRVSQDPVYFEVSTP